MDDFREDIFDEQKIKKAIKKGKRKSIIMIVFVSVIVFVVLNAINFAAYSYFSQSAFKQWDAYIKLSTPNGYISETVDTKGILGGESQFKVSKNMKIKSLVIEQKQYKFGVLPSLSYSRIAGNSIGFTGEDWQVTYKENGWRNLLFFHPDVTYQEYKHDEDLINQMQGEQIYEVALSFDKPYKQRELPLYELPTITWFWINTYSDSQLKTFQEKARKNDWSSTFIRENEALGFSVNYSIYSTIKLDNEYEDFLNLLQTSFYHEHHRAYDFMKDVDAKDVEILGIVVYGTKEELTNIIQQPFIKAVSLGGVINNY
ncbi:anti sigma factor C-terminal domain-containing protein [Sporosarcina highlanderae]|uniref:Anti sigma factor C-terminal domain-containing protein n=1 Tax=Sporosarcina highlanderae TaxID=3035916 RepID=A0ABT8JPZ3_9BACL|nr:anti sigma factor C-terminal domain-containing protein [Sporosarcina highlanderae]MDN4607027.1 anti sigma factor C-terminal domain-containing protein [Sporosarcina highlanderae]